MPERSPRVTIAAPFQSNSFIYSRNRELFQGAMPITTSAEKVVYDPALDLECVQRQASFVNHVICELVDHRRVGMLRLRSQVKATQEPKPLRRN
jgi:hypothetical protein